MECGVNQGTEVGDGDLFDFNKESEPILSVLCGKTLEQSRMEVLEEEELKVMKDSQKHYEEIRNVEIQEAEKLEEVEQKRH